MKVLLAAVFVAVSIAAFSQQEKAFSIAGKIQGKMLPVKVVYLTYRVNETTMEDSATLKNGSYSFRGRIVEPVRARLIAKPASVNSDEWHPEQKDVATIFISPSIIDITSVDSFSNITVKGSVAHDEYKKIEHALKGYMDSLDELERQYLVKDREKDEAAKNKILVQYKKLDKESKQVYSSYLKTHPSSVIAMYAIDEYAGFDINADDVTPLFMALPAAVKSYPSYKSFAGRLDIARKTSVGRPAIDFTQSDTSGTPVSLSSFRGKYVLVDFWASWCGPCRRENPNVVAAFNKYKDKGFTVLGVSLDQPNARARWLKAIHDDGLTWTHVSDLKFWNNEAAKLYGVRAIPFNLLVDKEGRIVARNIRGEELQSKLSEVFQ